MVRNIDIKMNRVDGELTNKTTSIKRVRVSIINFFVKYFFAIPMVAALDRHNRKAEQAYDAYFSYRRCLMDAEFLDRMAEYEAKCAHYRRLHQYHADRAINVAKKLNGNKHLKANNGFGVRPKYKVKYKKES